MVARQAFAWSSGRFVTNVAATISITSQPSANGSQSSCFVTRRGPNDPGWAVAETKEMEHPAGPERRRQAGNVDGPLMVFEHVEHAAVEGGLEAPV